MKKILITALLLFAILIGKSQYYNGLQISFGKNRIQYKPYNWRYYSYRNYDVYFYDRGVNLGKYTFDLIGEVMNEYEKYFSVVYNEKVIFVVYNKLSDFRQSNVGLQTDNNENNLGGTSELVDNKIFLYYEGNHQEFENQVRKSIARLYIRQILYGTAFTDKLTNTALLNVPEWFEEGLVSYVAQPYDVEVLNQVKDMLQNKKHIHFNHLSDIEAVSIGHSFWYFVADTYSDDVISNVLYFAKISKNIKNSVYFVLGKPLNYVTQEWRDYYEKIFDISNLNLPPQENEILKTKKGKVYQNLKISPDGKNIAYVENNSGKYKVFLYNIETQKKIKLFKEGQKLEQITDYSYPYLAWNKSGKILAFTTEDESIVTLWTYNIENEELTSRIIPYASKINSFSFSPNNYYIAVSALSNGYTDLFLFSLLTGSTEKITNDLPDDLYPTFNAESNKIIFSSNRTNDTIKQLFDYEDNYPTTKNYNLYAVDINKNEEKVLLPLTKYKYSNATSPINYKEDSYIFLSDSSGIINRYALTFDSTVSFVDTIVHYRYVIKNYQISDYSKNILSYDIQNNNLAEIIFDDNRYKFFSQKYVIEDFKSQEKKQEPDYFRQSFIKAELKKIESIKTIEENKIKSLQKLDSLKPFYEQKLLEPDTNKIDINNYSFEVEKDTLFRIFYNKQAPTQKDSSVFPQMRVYHPTFYLNDLNSMIDFRMLNETYQPFNGAPFYFNPGLSLFTTVSADELFNNYKLLGGFRYGINSSTEYLFSIENLIKRTDKQLFYYRQVLVNDMDPLSKWYYNIQKVIVNQLTLTLRYPFNQVTAVKLSLLAKYDRTIQMSTEFDYLVTPDKYKVYSGAKLEYIIDNSKNLSLNLYEGIKFKAFGEFYQQVEGDYNYTAVFGADLRVYKKIFRNFIYAGRIAGSSSIGKAKLLYYLGGVDNWYSLSLAADGSSNYFDYSVNINPDENYIFQAVATNMRGFKQNIRNGNNFALINQELRLPIVQVFANHPMSSDFWYNLQVIGFVDVGSAWNGWSPYDERNLYNTITVYSKPFTIIVDVDRPPFVWSYGWGLRTKILGYFVRLDWAYGKEANYSYDRKFYFSLSLDF